MSSGTEGVVPESEALEALAALAARAASRLALCSISSASPLRLTTRCDIALTMEPALESAPEVAEGDLDRFLPSGVKDFP